MKTIWDRLKTGEDIDLTPMSMLQKKENEMFDLRMQLEGDYAVLLTIGQLKDLLRSFKLSHPELKSFMTTLEICGCEDFTDPNDKPKYFRIPVMTPRI